MSEQTFPHSNNYARLGVSLVHGVGVFAIKDIPQDTNIFSDDLTPIVWINPSVLQDPSISAEHKRLYRDFCILRHGKLGCPQNFNSMTIGWYMNEPQPDQLPNVIVSENYDFIALRNISAGEELLTEYSEFSEPLERY